MTSMIKMKIPTARDRKLPPVPMKAYSTVGAPLGTGYTAGGINLK